MSHPRNAAPRRLHGLMVLGPLLLCGLGACGENDGPQLPAVGPIQSMAIPPVAPPPAQCVAQAPPCIEQLDCTGAAGTRCNTALDLPVCQTIRCGAEGSACSEDALC